MLKRKIALLLSILMIAVAVPFTAATRADGEEMRVKLSVGDVEKLRMTVSGTYALAEANLMFTGGTLTITGSGSDVTVSHSKLGVLYTGRRATIERQNLAADGGTLTFKVNGYTRSYLGSMTVTAAANLLTVVNRVPLSHYLYGVVGYEMSNSWPIEALRAQALAAKTYALASCRPSRSYDIGDTASDQVYKGYVSTLTNVIEAVDSTMGERLTLRGEVFYSYFAASNGGYMIKPSTAWSSGVHDDAFAEGYDANDVRNPSSLCETLFFPADLKEKHFTSSALYDFFMERLKAAVAEKDAIPAGYLYDSPAALSSAVSTGDDGGVEGRNHQNLVLTVTVNTVIDPATITPTPKPTATPKPTRTPKPTATPKVTATPAPTDTQEPTETPEPAPETTLLPGETPDPSVTATPEATPEITATPAPTDTPVPTDTPEPTDTPAPIPTALAPAAESTANVSFTIPFADLLAAGLFEKSVLRIYYAYPTDGGFTVYHGRYGHGVGMSQRGAQQMANEGRTYREIIAYYYPGAELTNATYTQPHGSAQQTGTGTELPTVSSMGTIIQKTALYADASDKTKAVETLTEGMNLTLTGLNGDYYAAVNDASGKSGYVHYGAVSVTGSGAIAAGYVNGDGVNLRKGPAKSFASAGKLGENTEVSVFSLEDGWYRVKTTGGLSGYMSKSYITVTKRSADAILAVTTPTPVAVATATPTPDPDATPTPVPIGTPKPTVLYTAYGQINATKVNFRTGPSSATASLGKYDKGMRFGVYGKTGSWYHVNLIESGQSGYVYMRYLTIEAADGGAGGTGTGTGGAPAGTATGKLSGSNVNLRTGPSTAYKSLGRLKKGTLLTITGSSGSWLAVKVSTTGQTGYIFAKYVAISDTSSGTPASSGQATINAGLLNLRAAPDSTKGKKLLTMRRGYTVTVHSIANGWAYVTFNGQKGYCFAKYLTMK